MVRHSSCVVIQPGTRPQIDVDDWIVVKYEHPIPSIVKHSHHTRPRQGRVKVPFYPGKGVEVKTIKDKDMTMG